MRNPVSTNPVFFSERRPVIVDDSPNCPSNPWQGDI
jgi:hypothetical protein